MSFIIRNVAAGAVTINDLGIDLPASLDEHDLSQEPPNDVAISSDLPANITAGNIAVLDPLDGVTPLATADALDLVTATNDPHYRIRGGSLGQLDDVDLTGLVNNQALQYNSTSGNFEAITPAGSPNLFDTFTGDSGSITAASPTSSLQIAGTTDQLTTAIAGSILTAALAPNTLIPGTEGIGIPSGTTAQRPVTPAIGDMRFNTDTNLYEAWDGIQWVTFGASPGSSVTDIKFGVIAQLTGTTQIPYDNTEPLITEGTLFFGETVTTVTDSGRVVIWFSSITTVSNANRIITISLFRDNTLIGVTAVGAPSSNSPVTTTFIVVDEPGAAGTYTYSGRIGVSAGATWYIGGHTPNANYGGAPNTNNQYVIMRME